MIGELIREARTLKPREALHAVVRGFNENDLLTYASAISFQVFFAIVPLMLLALGLLGLFGLTGVWNSDLAPKVQENVSPAAFTVINDTVLKVLGEKQLFWATAGALIALWEVSGAMRATMQVLDRIYEGGERTFWRRIGVSIWLSALVMVLLLTAAVSVRVVPALLGGGIAGLAGWLPAVVLLLAAVGAIVRFAPACERPLRWVSFGAIVVIVGWIAASLVFGLYITRIADYGSVFGSLSVVMVALGYLYLSSIVFLTGLQLDALIRDQVDSRSESSAEDEVGGGSDGVRVAGDQERRHDRVAPGV